MAVLTPQAVDFPAWYQDVVAKAAVAETGPVRGTMVIRPWGYAIWELLQAELDARIKAAGAENVYFPLLIPEGHLRREAEHIEGFSPELAVVTHAGGDKLEEPAVIRPTSETVFGEYLSRWVQSYRDLPMCLNQWANAVRWELRPRLLLRTTEFLWQEGHTVHATRADAATYARRINADVYKSVFEDVLAIPVITGLKTDSERFAGATATLTCEGMMRDGKALQLATSHELGQNFARAFDITYTDRHGALQHGWTTSWGSTTRMLGGMIMCHGDDAGLRLPPAVAPVQVVLICVKDTPEVAQLAERIEQELGDRQIRVRVDRRTDVGLGRRLTDWELKGVPCGSRSDRAISPKGTSAWCDGTAASARPCSPMARSTPQPLPSPPPNARCSTRPGRRSAPGPSTSETSTPPRVPPKADWRGCPGRSAGLKASDASTGRASPSGA
jgi:prolyl-tRNA synthetase